MLKKYLKQFYYWLFKIPQWEIMNKKDQKIHFKGGKPTSVEIGDHSYFNGLTIYS